VSSVPITTNSASSNPANSEVYSIQHYVIKFVSDLRQVRDTDKLIRIADTSAGAGIPSESTNLVTSQIMKRMTKRYAKRKAELSYQLRRKPKLDIRRIPDQPPEQRPFQIMLMVLLIPSFRTGAARREPCPWDLYVTYANKQDTVKCECQIIYPFLSVHFYVA